MKKMIHLFAPMMMICCVLNLGIYLVNQKQNQTAEADTFAVYIDSSQAVISDYDAFRVIYTDSNNSEITCYLGANNNYVYDTVIYPKKNTFVLIEGGMDESYGLRVGGEIKYYNHGTEKRISTLLWFYIHDTADISIWLEDYWGEGPTYTQKIQNQVSKDGNVYSNVSVSDIVSLTGQEVSSTGTNQYSAKTNYEIKVQANSYEGYIFEGFYVLGSTFSTDLIYANEIYLGATTTSFKYYAYADMTIYARWKERENNYIITFDRQGGSGGTSNIEVSVGNALPSITIPSLQYHTFQGYFVSPNGGGAMYYDENGLGKRNWDKSSDTTLYAYWLEDFWEYHYDSSFAGGNGTSTEPYLIETASQLSRLVKLSRTSTLSGTYYQLTSAIDLSDMVWRGIGNLSYKFAGTFDGGFYPITGIRITGTNRGKDRMQGLFGVTSNASIKNVIIQNCYLNTADMSGAIIGQMNNGSLQKCLVDTVQITGTYRIGGIVGLSTGGLISQCSIVNSNVSANTGGGLVGDSSGTILDCSVVHMSLELPSNATGNLLYGTKTETPALSSYAQGEITISGTKTQQKIMFGELETWTNWSYSPQVNEGYPVQNTLFAIGGYSYVSNVFNYLISLGFTLG